MRLITENQVVSSDKRIVLLVADGLGGLPQAPGGKTELETADTPNMDQLAREGASGLLDPIGPGITPGSGPAHLALFGYDPIENNVGRGLLAALGTGFDIQEGDVAARGNFCTLDDDGNVTDRRAGRIPTSESEPLCKKLEEEIDLGGVQVFVRSVKDHRFLLVLRGEKLNAKLMDTDPQRTGVPPLKCKPLAENAARTARLMDEFGQQARRILDEEEKANGALLRGFAAKTPIPSMADRFGLQAAALADYPMYRGLAKLVGMSVINDDPSLVNRCLAVGDYRDSYDFFYVHYKYTDARGEDGNFDAKVEAVEEFDKAIPSILEARPDVLIITGDHSTPAVMVGHSWHPVPMLMWGNNLRTDAVTEFGETAALYGGLGRMPMMHMMPLALAHADKLTKYGA